MKKWLAIGGLLLFLSLPAMITMVPTTPRAAITQMGAPPADQSLATRSLLTADERESVFREMWSLVDERYMYFDRKDVDWDAVRAKYLPEARAAKSDYELYLILRRTLAELGDGHVMIQGSGSDWARPRMYVMPDGEHLVIAEVEPGSDAEAAGFKAGMTLLEVDGRPAGEAWAERIKIMSASTPAAQKWLGGIAVLRGWDKTEVTVTAGFPGATPVTAAVVRTYDVAPFYPEFEQRVLPNGVVYIALTTFEHTEGFSAALRAIHDVALTQPPGLIIDLRFNGGGRTVNAEELSGYFTEWSEIVGWYLYHDTGSESWIRPRSKSARYDGPVVILTNPGCRSTCDLFATIMKQEKRATLVGQNPEGAGITYWEWQLQHGYKITMSSPTEFVDANKNPIEGNPAQVDYEVAPTAADWAVGRDPALEKALELLQAPNP